MRFLLPVGGVVDFRFGILTGPAHRGIPIGIQEGMEWAADNGVYTDVFNPTTYIPWLRSLLNYKDTCLFILAPDVVGDAKATLCRYESWAPQIRRLGFFVGFAAQDGAENLDLPTNYDALFVGGTTEWKLSSRALFVIKQAQDNNKHIHIGRVNAWRRYSYFRGVEGSENWTCDGTRTRYDGTDYVVQLWADYQQRSYTRRLEMM